MKSKCSSRWPRARQRGVALLLLMMILFASGSSLFLAAMNNRRPYLEQQEEVRRQLALAKEALLAYAANYADITNTGKGPGRLPCMDEDHDGSPETTCTSPLDLFFYFSFPFSTQTRVSMLPESLLLPGSGSPYQINRHFEGINQQFWYGVSWEYRESGGSPLNSSIPGRNRIAGNPDDMVAVLVAPGEALAWQDRNSGNITNYLERDTGLGIDNRYGWIFGTGNDAESFNDIVLGISRRELMSPVTARVAAEVKQQLDAYREITTTYPLNNVLYDISLTNAAGWFTDDQWNTVDNYTYVSPDEATLSFAGCAIVYTLNANAGITRAPNRC